MKYRNKLKKSKDKRYYANTANRVHQKNNLLSQRGGRHL